MLALKAVSNGFVVAPQPNALSPARRPTPPLSLTPPLDISQFDIGRRGTASSFARVDWNCRRRYRLRFMNDSPVQISPTVSSALRGIASNK